MAPTPITLLRRTESIRGVVEDPGGKPISDALVKIERKRGNDVVIGPFPRTAVTAPERRVDSSATNAGSSV
jgi:hypothetical protein